MNWKISPVVKMQNWPLLVVYVTMAPFMEGDHYVTFQITGTNAEKMLLMAEDVKKALDGEAVNASAS
jgi:hypothetical protein